MIGRAAQNQNCFKLLDTMTSPTDRSVLTVLSLSGLPWCMVGTVVSHQVSTPAALSSVKWSVTSVTS